MTMPAGTYYIGDLCYVMHPEWNEFCSITINRHEVVNGEFALDDGRRFAAFRVKYGDGSYVSNIGTEHLVDVGLMGCIRIEDITSTTATISTMNSIGAIVTFYSPFDVYQSNGSINFGHVTINVSGIGEDDDLC